MDINQAKKATKRSIWNHHPDLPIQNSPVFAWPPKPIPAAKWLVRRWVDVTATLLFTFVAIGFYLFLQPEPETMKTLAPGWIATIYVRNLVFLTIVAGGLHLYLFTFRRQGQKLKYDAREMMVNNGTFTFRNQVHDNMFWSLAGGVTAWTFLEVLYFWGAANGYAPTLTFAEAPVWFFVSLLLLPIWASMHFYWVHRFLHWPPMYKRVHSLHHRNVNVGPWSGLSMHPLESVIYLSSVLIHFVVPTHPVIFLLHMYIKAVGPAFSHAGFEKVLVNDKRLTDAGDFHHQLHHRYFECNYGTADMPWDKWFGSFHDGTDQAGERIKERRRKMYQN